MGGFYTEYCTLDELRNAHGAQLNIVSNADDAFLLSLIREVSADIDQMCNRTFAPYVATQKYDSPGLSPWSMNGLYYSGGKAGDVFQSKTGGWAYGRMLRIDSDDVLEVTALANGDGTPIAASNFLLYPSNHWPKEELRLVQSSGLAWMPDTSGNYEQVITLTGVFGYHDRYNGAWGGGGTVQAQVTTAGTACVLSAGSSVRAGHLLKLDSEYLYVSAIAGTTATIERGVNGTTAAPHINGTVIDYWRPMFTVSKTCRMGAAALWNLRANPEGKQVSVNGVTFTTPNSIMKWVDVELEQAGLQRTGLG